MQIELQIAGKVKRAAKARIRPTNNNTEKAKHKLKRNLPNQRKLLELLLNTAAVLQALFETVNI